MVVLPIKSKKLVKEFLLYLRSRNPRDALLFQTGVNTALRISDLLRLQVKQVAYPDGEIKRYIDINEKKNKKHNRILITSTLNTVYKAYIKRYGLDQDDYLFFRIKRADPDITRPITRDWASKVLVAAALDLKIRYFNRHRIKAFFQGLTLKVVTLPRLVGGRLRFLGLTLKKTSWLQN